MPRPPREDEPGGILHLFNRGLGKRTVFENRDDARYFQSRVAREHRRDRIRLLAFSIAVNHYHLIVLSPRGHVSEAMRVIQNMYVRRFNRQRERDGPLFRGRFGSRAVTSDAYWWTLLRYIDLHPVKAGITHASGLYPFGSAIHYLREEGPKWMTRD